MRNKTTATEDTDMNATDTDEADPNHTLPLATNPTVRLDVEPVSGEGALQLEVSITDSDGHPILELGGDGSRVELSHLLWGVYRYLEGAADEDPGDAMEVEFPR